MASKVDAMASIRGRRFVLALAGLLSLTGLVGWAQGIGGTVPTEKIFEAIGVREGVTVCEIGAGDGTLTLEAARAVGAKGRVFSSELPPRVEALQAIVTKSGLTQVTVVTGDPVKTNFPEAGCDALFMRNVYHHFAEPVAMDKSIVAALKPGGRLAIVDFTPPGAEAEKPADRAGDQMHGVSAASITREMKEAGLDPLPAEVRSGRWFMVVFAKPKGQG